MADPGQLRSPRTLPPHRATSSVNDLPTLRSKTDPVDGPRHERSRLHRRIHSNSVRARDLITTHARETVASAIELRPPLSFEHLLRRDRKNTGGSHRHKGSAPRKASIETDLAPRVAPPSTQDVARLQEAREQRERELAESLKRVEAVAMASTRTLDEKYYSLLERFGVLRATVAGLQGLAEESQRLHREFRDESAALNEDVQKSLDGASAGFDAQENVLRALVEQLQAARREKEALNARLEAARQRVAVCERRAEERMQARRRQWRIFLASFAATLVLLVAALVLRYPRPVGEGLHDTAHVLDQLGREIASPIRKVLKPTPATVDPYLAKLFDEL